jgi:hypothetical protein
MEGSEKMSTVRHERSREAARNRRAIRLCLGLTVTAVAAIGSALLPAVAGATSYVAMGDSYTSAPGVLPPSPTAPADCGQSAVNYPHLVATALNLSLTDVSCGGAKTENFTVAQHADQPPQFEALAPGTEVVTVGMGGNDHNLFFTLVSECTRIDFGRPNVGAPCREQLEGFVNKTLEEDKGPAEEALREIHVLSPNAKVFVVGYPDIAPAHGFCPEAIPWTAGDLQWLRNGVQIPGNTSLKEGARANGAIFVNTFTSSIGHDLCKPVGTRFIEPLIKPLTGVAVHPNALGEENDAFDVEKVMLNHGVR